MGEGDPVSLADLEANAMICRALAQSFPGAQILAEEGSPAGSGPPAAGRVFFVDPVDGTRELIERTGEFAVMIGLAVGGRPAAGVVALPAAGKLLAGRVGVGAFVQDLSAAPGKAARERRQIHVSACNLFSRARAVVSRSRPPRLLRSLRRRLGLPAPARHGSVGFKVARLATAEADLYLHDEAGLMGWDCCAPEAILVAAGGRMTDLDGHRIDYEAAGRGVALGRGLCATNGLLHAALLSAVAGAEQELTRRRGCRA
ncbi:MAG: 3'(2'),5'-bisphosphate nucleotidase CysQ [Deltaproteobacteria bacterium]|nr:3'(2'),5'-bisphosphate nucleotidase CysQ [Deltaproteobacteria bacterium]